MKLKKGILLLLCLTAFALSAPAQEAITVISNGNVGINQTAPTEKLEVEGNTKLNGNLNVSGDIQTNGDFLPSRYTGNGSLTGMFHAQDQKPSGTSGGNFTAGIWHTRILNTVVQSQSWASLSSNQITLNPGTYYIEARAPAYQVLRHRAIIKNITNSANLLLGSSEYSQGSVSTHSLIKGKITISTITTIEIQHRGQTTQNTYGFGVESNFGETEIYTDIIIWKLSD